MASASDFEHLDIMVRRKNGHCLASMPQINLFAAANSVPTALEILEKKKNDLVAELTAADCLDDFKIAPFDAGLYAPRRESKSVQRSALGFIGKTLVVVTAVVIGGVSVTRYTMKSIDQLLTHQSAEIRENLGSIGGAKFWTNLEAQIANLADPKNDLAPTKKEVLLAHIRTLVDRYRPFIREVSLLFYDPTEPSKSAQ